ncbi:MAG: glycosyltransferase [Bryobacteraceae bacterium]
MHCNVVFESRELKIVNIVAGELLASKVYDADWNSPVVWLLTPFWSLLHDPDCVAGLARIATVLPSSQRICVLINEPAEREVLAAIPNVETYFVNQNAFVSPRVFDIRPSAKPFDAVLNARPLRFKRAHLCARVDNLCCVRLNPDICRNAPDFQEPVSLRPAFVNHETLGLADVARLLNQSWCGLCLSECEGACYASTEYLYCGLPVVSTPSIGGRQVWYNERNSVIVEPSEAAVADGVARLKQLLASGALDPQTIRHDALSLRATFLARAEEMIGRYLAEFGLLQRTTARDVVMRWVREADGTGIHLKSFADARRASEYLKAGNVWYWREVVKKNSLSDHAGARN